MSNCIDDRELAKLDAATTALYQRVRSAPRNAELIARIESAEAPPMPPNAPRVIVMPGAFRVEHPQTGAGGERALALAQELGWPAERAAVPSLASMAHNAAALARLLEQRAGQPIILISLSKGGADVRAAMQRPNAPRELKDVRAWLNIGGLVYGTPLVQWLMRHRTRCCLVKCLLRLRGQKFAHLEELRGGSDFPLHAPFVPPAHIRVIHVIGFPLRRHLSNDWARRGHERLAPLGPNDGGGILLEDVLRFPGEVFPVWSADHYLRPAWDIRWLLLRLLRESARQVHACASHPSGTPASRSTA